MMRDIIVSLSHPVSYPSEYPDNSEGKMGRRVPWEQPDHLSLRRKREKKESIEV
jgi:hypothetical protein